MKSSLNTKFRSIFAEHLVNYIQMKQKLGYKYQSQAAILSRFDRYVYEAGYTGLLTQELALDYATANPVITKNEQARKYQTIRHFSNYLATFNPETPPLHPAAITRHKARPPAYIFSEDELVRLMDAAKHVSRLNPLRCTTLHAMVGLAAVTGMRVSEIVNLDRSDVNLNTGVIEVRRTKFQKDRLVPVHPSTLEILRNYAMARDTHFLDCKSNAFFINMWNQRFSKHTLSLAFYNLACTTGIRKNIGQGPHFHNLRHTFAVRRLVAWYRDGKDVQAMLPLLATYMGHVHYSETAYYLTATSELLGLASDRYQTFLQQEGCTL